MSGFRSSFGKLSKAVNWFPKHMNTGIKQMQAKLRSVDCILELHDARIPFSGRNPSFNQVFVGDKPCILILNKADLISNKQKKLISERYSSTNTSIIFTNCKDDRDSGLRKVIPMVKKKIETSNRYHRGSVSEYYAMIIGIPNVGKSSLINALRSKHLKKGRALKVAPSAGVTKMVHFKVKVSEDPTVFIYDTPGVLTPRIPDVETGMKLAVCGNLPDKDTGPNLIADYILFLMNKQKNFKYMEFFQLKEPTDCITTLLGKGAINLNLITQVSSVVNNSHIMKPNIDLAAEKFISAFRGGSFGRIVLDELETKNEVMESDEDYAGKEFFFSS